MNFLRNMLNDKFLHSLEYLHGVPMLPLISSLAVVLLALFFYFYNNHNLPPGPWGVPYLGYWPFLRNEDFHLQLGNMKNKYGDVFSFKVTGRIYIHLGTIAVMKEALVKHSNCFGKRYTDFNVLNFMYKEGILCQNEESWRELRKFFIGNYKEWGFNLLKSPMSNFITDSMGRFTEYLSRTQGSAIDVMEVITTQCSEIIHYAFYKKEGLDLEKIISMVHAFENIHTRVIGPRQLIIGNFAKYIIFPLTPGYNSAVNDHKYCFNLLSNVVKRHDKTFDRNNIRNVVDSFLRERYERLETGDPTAKYFSDNALIYSLMQFTVEGVLDISVFMCCFIEALLKYPQEQGKIYRELMEFVGPNRQPSLEDKAKLPYTNAFISEVTRTSDFFTLFPSLECTKDVVIGGYKIPKRSIILLNMWTAQHDASTFEKPHEFNPCRYFPNCGKKIAHQPVIFGMGKRDCIGEVLIMNMVFLFVTIIVYNFTLTTPETKYKEDPQSRISNVCFTERTHV